jgi:hypothetical protein
MPRPLTLLLVSVVAVLSMAPIVRADYWHALGRHLGHGWGDGYHSRAACPPKQLLRSSAPPAKSVPWWMIPAEGAEPLPAPGEVLPSPSSATGPSLFRQPGEGSSVHPSAAPSIMR